MNKLIEDLVSEGFLKTPRIINAFRHIDRADFVPEELKFEAYVDAPLPIGFGQTISQPLTVAFMLELLDPKPGDKILDIGSGSGWQTALLAFIVSHNDIGEELPADKKGKIISIELIPELEAMGRKNIFKYNFIKKGIVDVHCLNAAKGFPSEAPYEKIIAAASTDEIPKEWENQLKVYGSIVAPIESSLWRYKKKEDGSFEKEEFPGFAFVPFIKE
ncbi:MAG: protein-L-isoaspartate O-methyltransferase [Parcubacteria group bacterium]|nr:protein-L-isoaspartate O-methyltransferase [Parcubacteria group bacterium]MCR4342849.1 protein-L-isoaspartate O-methyltransferase [Patescibacteria group bacterium]